MTLNIYNSKWLLYFRLKSKILVDTIDLLGFHIHNDKSTLDKTLLYLDPIDSHMSGLIWHPIFRIFISHNHQLCVHIRSFVNFKSIQKLKS